MTESTLDVKLEFCLPSMPRSAFGRPVIEAEVSGPNGIVFVYDLDKFDGVESSSAVFRISYSSFSARSWVCLFVMDSCSELLPSDRLMQNFFIVSSLLASQ